MINLLLVLANDTFDMQAIFENKFKSRPEKFSPKKVLQFVQKLFATQCKIQDVELSLKTGDQDEINQLVRAGDYDAMLQIARDKFKHLPEFLIGDQVRFKQVLINVVKTFLSGISKCKATIDAHYDEQSQ